MSVDRHYGHKFVGFAHCLDCAKEAYNHDMDDLRKRHANAEQEVAELKATNSELNKLLTTHADELGRLQKEVERLRAAVLRAWPIICSNRCPFEARIHATETHSEVCNELKDALGG